MRHVGDCGEAVVAAWLQTQQCQILAQNWSCPWGELDIVACDPEGVVLFVEVKTRRSYNWDRDGLDAISPSKQRKLVLAAQAFLESQPQWQEHPCRFDVALVRHQRGAYWLHCYLEQAFTLDSTA
ncbi:MAG: YraN family protein [Cyanobacteria bacterium J003]|uniref:YraN family protein n=1 Tax=Thermosynechococcus sp. M3746_W2019_013 TaxID=2747806 RepID=UPI000F281441|nr:YraN family protein [Thermosynechococcus sp. M3746_W2019_013]RMH65869.1 MAG: YraN family protein [Cyanobacteria bacterium J003]HIK23198.1 YraN family protein [Thermosynechococcus sp. M3746_W2019_013]